MSKYKGIGIFVFKGFEEIIGIDRHKKMNATVFFVIAKVVDMVSIIANIPWIFTMHQDRLSSLYK